MLFAAELMSGETITAAVVFTAVGGGVKWLYDAARTLRSEKRKDVAEHEKTTIQHYVELLEREKAERQELYAEVVEMRKTRLTDLERLTKAEVMIERCRGRIRHLEDLMKSGRTDFREWDDEDGGGGGSNTHMALPPAPGDRR